MHPTPVHANPRPPGHSWLPPALASAPLLTGIASFIVLLVGTPGDVWFRDAGQLTAASWSLGVAHPTGFPAVMLVGRLATLLPFGSIAWRMGLVSAACAAGAIALAASTALALVPRQAGAALQALVAAAAALLLANPTWWLHATAPEVYAPTALFILAGARLVVAALEPDATRRPALLLALLTGLSLGAHITAPLSLAVAWVVLLATAARRHGPRATGRLLLTAAPLVLAGALVLAYLPAAAAHDPWRNWGDPSTLGRALAHATGASIREAFEGTIGATNPLVLRANLLGYGAQLADGLGAALALAAGGVWWLVAAGRRSVAAALLGMWITDTAFTVLVNPMGIVDRQTGVPSLAVAAVLAALGAGGLLVAAARVAPRVHRAVLAAAVATLVVAALATAPGPKDARPRGGWAELWGRATLAQVPPGGIVATSMDDTTGVLTCLLGVEGSRPDVAHLPLAHLYDAHEIAHWQRLYGARVIPDAALAVARDTEGPHLQAGAQRAVLEAILLEAAQAGTPVLWEPAFRDLDAVVAASMRPGWPLWPLTRNGARAPYPVTDAQAMPPRWEALTGTPPDGAARRLLALTARNAALVEIGRGRALIATSLLAGAATLAPDEPKVLSNLLTLRARAGALDEALSLARRLVEVAPSYGAGRLDLAGLLLATGAPEEAEEHALAGLSLSTRPRHKARALVLLGQVSLSRGEHEDAVRRAREALEAAPGYADAETLMRDASR